MVKRKRDKNKIREYSKRYREKNREKIRIRGREFYKKNKDKLISKRLEWINNNKEIFKERDKISRKKNKKHILEHQREWRKNNREKVNAHKRANWNGLRGDECLVCKTKESLCFHHTDYKKDIGITLCSAHHRKIHSLMLKFNINEKQAIENINEKQAIEMIKGDIK